MFPRMVTPRTDSPNTTTRRGVMSCRQFPHWRSQLPPTLMPSSYIANRRSTWCCEPTFARTAGRDCQKFGSRNDVSCRSRFRLRKSMSRAAAQPLTTRQIIANAQADFFIMLSRWSLATTLCRLNARAFLAFHVLRNLPVLLIPAAAPEASK